MSISRQSSTLTTSPELSRPRDAFQYLERLDGALLPAHISHPLPVGESRNSFTPETSRTLLSIVAKVSLAKGTRRRQRRQGLAQLAQLGRLTEHPVHVWRNVTFRHHPLPPSGQQEHRHGGRERL